MMRLKVLKPFVRVERDGSNVHGGLDDVIEVPRNFGLELVGGGIGAETAEPLHTYPPLFQMVECPARCGMINSSLSAACENPQCRIRLR